MIPLITTTQDIGYISIGTLIGVGLLIGFICMFVKHPKHPDNVQDTLNSYKPIKKVGGVVEYGGLTKVSKQ